MVDEAHVTTIGVHPDHRGRAAGELLFLGLTDLARQMRAFRMTLEAARSTNERKRCTINTAWKTRGSASGITAQTGGDRWSITWSEPINSREFQARVANLREQLADRMARTFSQQPPPSRPVDATRLQ